MLLRRSLADAGLATYRAKDKYNRSRPFAVGNDRICTPEQEASLRKDGSYPSGHAALGWAWSLILTEIAPDRANAVIQRGLAFARSRQICGVHWQSDVMGGMIVGSAVVAQLHANADFVAQLGAARKEYEAARAGANAAIYCADEAAALALK
jgi:acid phosphatase (class A)